MTYATGKMEYSDDPLSDTTPTYVDRSSYVIGDVTWSDGKARDLDEPQAGSITFRLRNDAGQWVPNSASSLYPDSPFLLRRFRWSVNGTAEGVWYVVNWHLTYPAGTAYSEVEVTCVDGFELLSLDNLALLDPPSATSYEEVVGFDSPWGFYRLGEAFGTRVVSQLRTVGRGKRKRKVRQGRDVIAPGLEGVAGAAGTYEGLPQLGQPSLILGDSDTCVRFTGDSSASQLAVVSTNDDAFSSRQSFTVEAWVKPAATSAIEVQQYVTGPDSGVGPLFSLYAEVGATGNFVLESVNGGGTPFILDSGVASGVGVTRHLVGMLHDRVLRVFVDGVEAATLGFSGVLPAVTSTQQVSVGGTFGTSAFDIDEVAIYEHALTADRVMAHYQAGAERGFTQETAGLRLVALADNPLWSTAFIQTAGLDVIPEMKYGQSKLDEIREAVKAEMPDTHFYFDGDGNPTYLAWDYKGTAPYNEPQGVFGAGPGEIGYSGVELVYDDELFNEVTVGHESGPGEETQHTVTDDDSIDEFLRRAHAETGLTLSEHDDAVAVAAAILEAFHTPTTRVASLTVNGAHTDARTQILERQIGDLIRVKGVGGTPDMLATILGRAKTLTTAGHLACTWSLSRGLDASLDAWYLGVDGYTELGQTTTLG